MNRLKTSYLRECTDKSTFFMPKAECYTWTYRAVFSLLEKTTTNVVYKHWVFMQRDKYTSEKYMIFYDIVPYKLLMLRTIHYIYTIRYIFQNISTWTIFFFWYGKKTEKWRKYNRTINMSRKYKDFSDSFHVQRKQRMRRIESESGYENYTKLILTF